MKHTEGKFAGAGGLELFYQAWQPDTPPRAVIAVVHGLGEHSGRYLNVVNRLAPHGYSLYGFDLRGHGRSPGQRGYINSWEEYREDVRAFLRFVNEQEPGRPLFLLGHSLGGLIALEYVLHFPEGLTGVIASSPALAQANFSPFLLTLSRILSRLWPTFSLNTGLDATTISRDPAVVTAYVGDPLVHGLGTPRLATEAAAAMEWTQAHAADLRLPLCLLYGSADKLVPPEGSRAFFERVTCADRKRIEYPGGYHESFNDVHREQVLDDVEQWLAQHL
jgi:alpha-beta hydrolase superfamily lysophospholipase